MGPDCGPSGAEGSSDGLAQGFELWRALALARWRKTLQFLRSSVLQFQRQKRPSGNDLAGQGLGTSVLWTFVHRGAPCQRIVLYAAAVQPGWSGMKQRWRRWPSSFFQEGNHPSFLASSEITYQTVVVVVCHAFSCALCQMHCVKCTVKA